MSSPASTAPRATSYIVGKVQASPDLPATLLGDPPLVCYGHPGTYQPACIIAVGSAVVQQAAPRQIVGSGGAGWVYETYRLQVTISCYQGGENTQQVQEAAYTCWQAVAGAVRADPSLGGLCIDAFPASYDMATSWEQEHMGVIVEMTCEIEVEAQL